MRKRCDKVTTVISWNCTEIWRAESDEAWRIPTQHTTTTTTSSSSSSSSSTGDSVGDKS